MTNEQYIEILTRISDIKHAMEPLEDSLKPLKEELDNLKSQAVSHMRGIMSKRADPINGYYVIRTEGRVSVTIDQEAAAEWLTANGYRVGLYMKRELDPAKLKELAEERLKADGEVLEFVHVTKGSDFATIKQEGTK